MTDIVDELRNAVETDDPALDEYALEAANEIEQLRSKLEYAVTGYKEAADEIELLRTENKMLELELAEAARHMDAQDAELKRLRMLEFELRSDIALAPLSPKGSDTA